MNLISLILVMALAVTPAYGETKAKKKDQRTFIERLFGIKPPKQPPHGKQTRKSKHTSVKETPTPVPTPAPAQGRSKDGAYIVNAQWMAYYWEQELAWNYPIPEDQDVKFINGNYHVPPVVYRHYEDMVNAATARAHD